MSTHLLCPVEYLHYRLRQGRGQRAEGKEEGCKVQGNNDCLGEHDITVPCSLILPNLNRYSSRHID
ncbi:MAG: hypothetical protein RIE73_13420 [Coleofasciculus sp. C1-SOL-03]|uniref:hypothetical protein n=1 Tax=Coleofasciculus sp. C1-SOL-03 TaxID=3069522 RepID=UPI0032F2FE04